LFPGEKLTEEEVDDILKHIDLAEDLEGNVKYEGTPRYKHFLTHLCPHIYDDSSTYSFQQVHYSLKGEFQERNSHIWVKRTDN